MSKDTNYHISQFFNLSNDDEVDFFDANLVRDSRVFIDPFLLKNSPVEAERQLFERFGDFFRFAYDKSLESDIAAYSRGDLKKLLTFPEPKYINMGYTASSNAGHGPSLADRLMTFFVDTTARRFVRETEAFPEQKYNPISLQVFTDGIGFDGISDITANLIMDYLIGYTIEQADRYGVARKPNTKVDHDGFDFEEMKWKRGGYYELPRNPIRPNEPLLLVPHRLIRGLDEVYDNPPSLVMSILRTDPELATEFASLVSKPIKEINIEDVREVFKQDTSVHKRYLESLELGRNKPYNFEKDPLNLLADKKFAGYFDDTAQPEVTDDSQLNDAVKQLIEVFKNHFEIQDGWKQAWASTVPPKPAQERAIGMILRGMGLAYFARDDATHFIPETGTGNGSADFTVIHGSSVVVIELKLLGNSAKAGPKKVSAYIHGITHQLPNYAHNLKAKYAHYVTGQHFKSDVPKQRNDTPRIAEIQAQLPSVEADLKTKVSGFQGVTYTNVVMVPHGTASEL